MSSAASQQSVSIRSPAELLAVIPSLLGFAPAESVVLLSLHARARLGLTMRVDLRDERDDPAVASFLAARMRHDGAEKVVVAVFTREAPDDTGMPRSGLVDEIADALPVPLMDAFLVRDGRYWSYLCADDGCCPPDGRPLEAAAPGALALAAAQALHGRVVLPDRDAVVASVAPIGGLAAVSMRQAIDRAAEAYAAAGERFVRSARDLLETALERYADPPGRLTDDEVASIVVAAHDIPLRDDMIGWTATRYDAMHPLMRDVVRRAMPPLDAPVCTVLAWLAYSDGDGVVASSLLDRALASEPSYSLAHLLADALASQVHPRELKRVLRALDH